MDTPRDITLNCTTGDPDSYFPEFRGPGARERARELARTLCDGCPRIFACRAQALAEEIGLGTRAIRHNGIRGGLSPADRVEIRDTRRARRAA